ncbi:tRNA (guanosine(46)-N7)-methyltransferase TrmB [Marinimicrococcus flavescens]|uniref:tRNA (guanine-N(7)-)-methyltransferase n=1 Tax=Marinimicrococcus flavescens TaxID=3031815 RepID=A0AAP3UYX8_9PROT|nr:tRNA (guanosine(46)-N7)-methyltransferase TrmB [Marinimicrococcus flavescens]
MTNESNAARPQRRIYGRRLGPRLRPGRRRLLDELLPSLRFTVPEQGGLDPASLFVEPKRAFWLEIGFGGGEHLAAQAAASRDVGLLGVEPFLSGVAALLAAVEQDRLENVRLLVDDARLLLASLPDASIERLFVLFPDPWPKARHKKRRIVNRETVAEMARIVQPGGELRLATDDPDYARWMLEALLAEPRLEWLAERAADWRARTSDWVETRYERKALDAGRLPVYLRFRRRAEG